MQNFTLENFTLSIFRSILCDIGVVLAAHRAFDIVDKGFELKTGLNMKISQQLQSVSRKSASRYRTLFYGKGAKTCFSTLKAKIMKISYLMAALVMKNVATRQEGNWL